MSKSINMVILLGHVGKDPELRYTSSGKAVASFSLATSEEWKDGDGQKQSKTEWHNIIVWQKLAEIVGEYVKKGSHVEVVGKLTHRSYDDKNGVKRYVTEVVMDNLVMLDTKGDRTSAAPPEEPAAGKSEKADDLPF